MSVELVQEQLRRVLEGQDEQRRELQDLRREMLAIRNRLAVAMTPFDPPLTTAGRAREVAGAHKALGDQFATMDLPTEAARSLRQAERWLHYADTLLEAGEP
jgi:hypothetical protein